MTHLDSLDIAIIRQPSLHIHHRRVAPPQRLHIRPIPIRREPSQHDIHLRHAPLQCTAQEPQGCANRGAGLVLKRLAQAGEVEFIAGQADGLVVPLAGVRKGLRGEEANVGWSDPL